MTVSDRNTVLRRSDYLPFGVRMEMDDLQQGVGRSGFFGFSGKENEMWPSSYGSTGVVASPVQSIPHWELGERYQHFGARAYDPLTCTFMQTDPLAEKYYGTSPYAYCGNNPVTFVDPDGEDPIGGGLLGGLANYTGQVLCNWMKKKDENLTTKEIFVDKVDFFDVGISAFEGALTSGGSVFRKLTIGSISGAFQSTVDISSSDGIKTNGVEATLVGGVLGALSSSLPESDNSKGLFSTVKSESNSKIVARARQNAANNGESLTPKQFDSLRHNNNAKPANAKANNKMINNSSVDFAKGGVQAFFSTLLGHEED